MGNDFSTPLPLPRLMLISNDKEITKIMEENGIMLNHNTVQIIQGHSFVEYTLPEGWSYS